MIAAQLEGTVMQSQKPQEQSPGFELGQLNAAKQTFVQARATVQYARENVLRVFSRSIPCGGCRGRSM
jgi:hypothetical protein